jgi:hypothetical protein
MSVRIDENGVKTEKLWLKHDSRGLFVEDLKLEGMGDGRFYFRKGQGTKQKEKDLFMNTFKLMWTAG